MLTRSRFGFFANENAVAGAKDIALGNQKVTKNPSIATRSRSALGDIKNKGLDFIHKDAGKQKVSKKEQKPEIRKICDMSICADGSDTTTAPSAGNDELRDYRMLRYKSRRSCLTKFCADHFLELDNDIDDPATVSPFAESIFNYLQDTELSVQPLVSDFMGVNPEITPRMRYILVNWLVQVHYSYKLQPETLYLCVSILDRYLSRNCKSLTKDCFQLIGIACLFIAAKFEEMYPPDISDYSSITNNAYSKSDIRSSEMDVLQTLDFILSVPIPLVFLRRLSRAVDADKVMHNLAKYFLELTIVEYDLAFLPGNLRAVMALCLSRAICMETPLLEKVWCDKIEYISGYKLDNIRPHLQVLARAAYRQNSPSKYRAVFNKYRLDDLYGRVASLPQLRSNIMETLADLKFDSDGEVNLD